MEPRTPSTEAKQSTTESLNWTPEQVNWGIFADKLRENAKPHERKLSFTPETPLLQQRKVEQGGFTYSPDEHEIEKRTQKTALPVTPDGFEALMAKKKQKTGKHKSLLRATKLEFNSPSEACEESNCGIMVIASDTELVVVNDSGIYKAGLGLFARDAVTRGTTLGFFGGELVCAACVRRRRLSSKKRFSLVECGSTFNSDCVEVLWYLSRTMCPRIDGSMWYINSTTSASNAFRRNCSIVVDGFDASEKPVVGVCVNDRLTGGGGGGAEKKFLSLLSIKKANNIVAIKKDGNCLFRAIAYHYYGNREKHLEVRKEIVNGLIHYRDEYLHPQTRSSVYDSDYISSITGGNPSYEAYVEYVDTIGSHGDTGCLEVFQKLHPDFGYLVWSGIPVTVKLSKDYGWMSRCAIHQRNEILRPVGNKDHPMDDSHTLHFWHHGNHFDVFAKVCPTDMFSLEHFIREQDTHVHRPGDCGPANAEPYRKPCNRRRRKRRGRKSGGRGGVASDANVGGGAGYHVSAGGEDLVKCAGGCGENMLNTVEMNGSLSQWHRCFLCQRRLHALCQLGGEPHTDGNAYCSLNCVNGNGASGTSRAASCTVSSDSEYNSCISDGGVKDANPRKGRPTNSDSACKRLSARAIEDLKKFVCPCHPQDTTKDCHEFLASGNAVRIRQTTWDAFNPKERSALMRSELQTGLYWCETSKDFGFNLVLNYMRVCITTWSFVHGFPRSSIRRALKEIVATARENKSHDILSAGSRRAITMPNAVRDGSNLGIRAYVWLRMYAKECGEKMPIPISTKNDYIRFMAKKRKAENAAQEIPPNESSDESCDDDAVEDGDDRVQIRLPQVCKQDVYAEYSLSCEFEGEGKVSLGHFLKIWKSKIKNLKCSKPKGTHSMCNVCGEFTGLLKNAKTDGEHDHWVSQRAIHWALQRAQREKYYENRLTGMIHKDTHLSVIMDAMDQAKTHLPTVTRKQKNDQLKLIKQKLMGVMVHGHGTYVYVAHPPLATGTNFSIECLWRTLMKLDDKYAAQGRCLPSKITIQLDNASDNKSKAMLAFETYLVEQDIFEEVQLNFLLVGHTHEDIDQYFSVISGRFKRLVFQSSAATVFTFKDFQNEVMNAYASDKKPECVELVRVNHDFVAWLLPARDTELGNITRFKQFTFRYQNDDEKAFYAADGMLSAKYSKYDNSAVCVAKQYMTSPDSDCSPNDADKRDYGPNAILGDGHVQGQPGLALFKDLTQPTKGPDGELKTVHKVFVGKTSNQILEIYKRQWIAWVDNPAHGASEEQKDGFTEMLNDMVTDLAALSPEAAAENPEWRLPLSVRARRALPSRSDVINPRPAEPLPRMAYGSLSMNEATSDIRQYRRDLEVHDELQVSDVLLAGICDGDIVAAKGVSEDGEQQLWLAIAKENVDPMDRSEAAGRTFTGQWLQAVYAKTGNRRLQQVPGHDLNQKYIDYYVDINGKPEKCVEDIARLSVVLIGVQLIGSNCISVSSKKAIASLKIGYVYNSESKKIEVTESGVQL